MPKLKIAISLEQDTLRRLDRLVAAGEFPSRSRAIEEAVTDKIRRLKRIRLARECRKVDPKFEKALAEEWLRAEIEWPEY